MMNKRRIHRNILQKKEIEEEQRKLESEEKFSGSGRKTSFIRNIRSFSTTAKSIPNHKWFFGAMKKKKIQFSQIGRFLPVS